MEYTIECAERLASVFHEHRCVKTCIQKFAAKFKDDPLNVLIAAPFTEGHRQPGVRNRFVSPGFITALVNRQAWCPTDLQGSVTSLAFLDVDPQTLAAKIRPLQTPVFPVGVCRARGAPNEVVIHIAGMYTGSGTPADTWLRLGDDLDTTCQLSIVGRKMLELALINIGLTYGFDSLGRDKLEEWMDALWPDAYKYQDMMWLCPPVRVGFGLFPLTQHGERAWVAARHTARALAVEYGVSPDFPLRQGSFPKLYTSVAEVTAERDAIWERTVELLCMHFEPLSNLNLNESQ